MYKFELNRLLTCYTAYGNQYELRSWFPRPVHFLDYGYWPPFYETWFVGRLNECRDLAGKAQPLSTKEWAKVKALRFSRAVTLVKNVQFRAARDLGIHAVTGVEIMTAVTRR